jgi:Tol biopolymer transport system component
MSSKPARGAVLGLLLLQLGGGCEGHGTDDEGATPAVTVRVSTAATRPDANGDSRLEAPRPWGGEDFTQQNVSADGRYVVFESDASDLVAGDANGVTDVFVRDAQTGALALASLDPSGAAFPEPSVNAAISADGRYVAFESGLGFSRFIYRRDLVSGTTERVTPGATTPTPGRPCFNPSLSADGRFIAFESSATDLIPAGAPGETSNTFFDIYRRDMNDPDPATRYRRVNMEVPGGGEPSVNSFNPSISGDGRYVAFNTYANLLGESGFSADVYVRDVEDTTTFQTWRITLNTSGAEPDDWSFNPVLSLDGNVVAFESDATDLVPGDTNNRRDVFVRARTGGPITRVSVNSGGGQATSLGSVGSRWASLSADGRFVSFHSDAFNLVTGDANQALDVFVRDTTAGRTVRASVRTFGGETLTGQDSAFGSLSSDGRFIAFTSFAGNLVDDDLNGFNDVFLHGPLR